MRTKRLTGKVDKAQPSEIYIRATYQVFRAIAYLFTRWYIDLLLFILLVLVGVYFVLSSVIYGLVFVVIGLFGVWASLNYIRHADIHPFETRHAVTSKQLLKAYKHHYEDFSMSEEEQEKSADVSKKIIEYFLDNNFYDVRFKGQLYKDIDNHQYEVVDVPDVVLLYHYDENGLFDNKSSLIIWADVRFVNKLNELESEVNMSLSITGLKSLKVLKSEIDDEKIVYSLEDVKQNDGFNFMEI